MTCKINTNFELKELSETGEFSGYGSVFGNVDSYYDVVEKGAFANSIKEFKSKNKFPPVLWQHNPSNPIGVYSDMKEDDHGLYVEGKLALKTTLGGEAHELLKMRAIDGLSIGYSINPNGQTINRDTGINHLTDLKLWEVSLVTFPANERATVEQVKQILSGGELPSERDFERFLRDSGFSKKQALAIVSGGYRAIRRDAETKRDEGAVIGAIEKLINSMKV